jgi:hypothetical protein
MRMPCPLINTMIAEADRYCVGFIDTVPRNKIEGSLGSINSPGCCIIFEKSIFFYSSIVKLAFFILISESTIDFISALIYYSVSFIRSPCDIACDKSKPLFPAGYKL